MKLTATPLIKIATQERSKPLNTYLCNLLILITTQSLNYMMISKKITFHRKSERLFLLFYNQCYNFKGLNLDANRVVLYSQLFQLFLTKIANVCLGNVKAEGNICLGAYILAIV